MKHGLNLVQVLRESQKTRKQITKMYVKFDPFKKEIKGYCAMGALFCESDNVESGSITCGDSALFQCYGIDYDSTKRYICPSCGIERELASFIIHLNDHHECTFEEIANVLENVGF